jgi:hyperosmotically inducible periplasmic protein
MLNMHDEFRFEDVGTSPAFLVNAARVCGAARSTQEVGSMARMYRALAAIVAVLTLTAGCQTTTGKTAGTVVDDSSITASVKAKLVADKPANLTRVDVDTNNGTVYLNGVVDTPAQRARAEELARQATGVKTVVNNLQVAQRR